MVNEYENAYTLNTGEWTIVRHFLNNPLRNFNYVLIHEASGKALSVDPTDVAFNQHVIERYSADLIAILLTHEHPDHVEGVSALARFHPQVNVYGPHGIESFLDPVIAKKTNLVRGDEAISLGGISLQVVDLSGHTLMHIGYYIADSVPILISGDTIFALGIGHCRYGGDVASLFTTIEKIRSKYDDGKTIYLPGHDLLESNLAFTKKFDWQTFGALGQLDYDPESRPLRSISDECRENVFFNCDDKTLAEAVSGNAQSDSKTVFTSLRAQRDKW